jgi:hypothetical protein
MEVSGSVMRCNLKDPLVHTKAGMKGDKENHSRCFSGGINEEGLRPMSRRL